MTSGFIKDTQEKRWHVGGTLTLAATVLFCAMGASAGAPTAANNSAKIASDLSTSMIAARFAKNNTPIRVIVRLSQQLTQAQREQIAARVTVLGRRFQALNTIVVTATPAQIDSLVRDGLVVSVSPDRTVKATDDNNAIHNLDRTAIGAGANNKAYSQVVSSGGDDDDDDKPSLAVAVLDSGVANVPEIGSRISYSKDLVNGLNGNKYDDFGHGTHVAGIIAGKGSSSSSAKQQVRGVANGLKANNIKIVSVKVLNQYGEGTVANVLNGIDWCITNKNAYKIRVINLSLSAEVFGSHVDDPLCQAAKRAVEAGIVVVVSAGNHSGGYGGIGAPGNSPYVITVGATNSRATAQRGNDSIATFSARGPSRFDALIKPDVVAPGNNIISLRAPNSTIDTLFPQTRVPRTVYLNTSTPSPATSAYTYLSGTSQAAPFVAGAAAILLDVNPALTPNGVKAALMYSAQLINGYDAVRQATVTYDPLTQGAGLVNVPGAAHMASLMRPTIGLRAIPALTSSIEGQPFTWSGVELKTLLQRPQATAILWGGGTGPASNVSLIWGGNSVWGTAILWGGGTGPVAAAPVAWTDDSMFGGELVTGNAILWGGGTGPGQTFAPEDVAPTEPVDVVWGNAILWGGGTGPASVVNTNAILWGGGTGLTSPDAVYSASLTFGGTSLLAPDSN